MTKDELERLLPEPESLYLDWKMDFPPELAQSRPQPEWDKGRAKLLRSLVALANSHGSTHAHLVYGVEDLGAERRIHGISRSFDDADFQQWAENTFDPPPTFRYAEVKWGESTVVGMFRIERTPDYPHVVQAGLGGILSEGQVWFRRGSKNTVALRSDLQRMFLGETPFKIARLDDPTLKQINRALPWAGSADNAPTICRARQPARSRIRGGHLPRHPARGLGRRGRRSLRTHPAAQAKESVIG